MENQAGSGLEVYSYWLAFTVLDGLLYRRAKNYSTLYYHNPG